MLNKGTKLDPRNLTAAEIAPTASIEVVKRLRSTPFGENYLGSQGNTKLLLTSFEPDFVTERETRDRLMQSLATAGASRHDSLLTTFGSIEVSVQQHHHQLQQQDAQEQQQEEQQQERRVVQVAGG